MLITTLILLPLFVHAGDLASDADSFCKEQWTKAGELDHGMYEYCRKEQKNGFTDAENFRLQYGTLSWFKTHVQNQCIQQWTKAGIIQQNMVAYCYKQQLDAYKELSYQSTQPGYNSGLAEACFRHWSGSGKEVFNMTAYCYKNNSATPDPGLPTTLKGLLQATAATASTAPAAAARKPSATEDLVGFDLKLAPDEFRKAYSDKIKSCHPDKYKNAAISETFDTPIYVCEFNDKNGSVRFYATGGKYHIYRFVYGFPQKGVKMRVAATKLEEKVGAPSTKQTYTTMVTVHCGAQVPFYEGLAVVISANTMLELINKYGRAAGNHLACDDDIYLNVDAETVQYDNESMVKVMDENIARQRIKAEDEKGKDLKL